MTKRNDDGTVQDEASAEPREKQTTQARGQAKSDAERSGRGDEVDPRSGGEPGTYDPTQDPTFNANTAQRYAEPGTAGSDEAADAQEEVS